jgi:hypothetical protein
LEDFLLGRKEEKGQAKRRKIGCKKIWGKQIDEFGTFLLGAQFSTKIQFSLNLPIQKWTSFDGQLCLFIERWRNRLLALKLSFFEGGGKSPFGTIQY